MYINVLFFSSEIVVSNENLDSEDYPIKIVLLLLVVVVQDCFVKNK